MAMTLVSTVTVGSGGAASIEFTGIPQTGKDLLLLVSARASNAGVSSTTRIRFNGNSGANYTTRRLTGDGAASDSSAFTNQTEFITFNSNGNNSTASTFGNGSIYVSNYTSSANKSISVDGVWEANATTAEQMLVAGSWAQTAAITSLSIFFSSANAQEFSTASLYIIS